MEWYLALIFFSVSTTVTPGPNNIMIMTSGLNYGIKYSLPHLLGICLGFPSMVLMIGLGFGFVFESFPWIHEIIRIFGIIYLLYLAWHIATSSVSLDNNVARPFSFIQAALFQWVNPKAWIMATGAVSTFTYHSPEVLLQVCIIGLTFLIVSFPCVGIWLFFGSGLKKYLKSPEQQKVFNMSMAILLVCSVLPVLNDFLTR